MQVGSLDWAEVTNGRLTATERRTFVLPAIRQSLAYTAGRLRLLFGRRGRARLNLDSFVLPDSQLAREAEQEARETITPAMYHHSVRTFFFGVVLADLDDVAIDLEHLYVGALLHDIALESPDAGACFAVRGARTMLEVVSRAGADDRTARTLAEGVAHHITPGVGFELGPLAPMLQFGAMVDLVGQRLWDLDPDFVSELVSRYPRHGLKRHLAECWRTETRTFRGGRAAFTESIFRFSLLVRFAPFAE